MAPTICVRIGYNLLQAQLIAAAQPATAAYRREPEKSATSE